MILQYFAIHSTFFFNSLCCNETHRFKTQQIKSEHCTKLPKPGGHWGTTTYIGPQTVALAIVSVITVVGWIIVLLFCPLDERDVYRRDGNLYHVNGDYCKTASSHNFLIRHSRHV